MTPPRRLPPGPEFEPCRGVPSHWIALFIAFAAIVALVAVISHTPTPTRLLVPESHAIPNAPQQVFAAGETEVEAPDPSTQPRSPAWRKLRNRWLNAHPMCECCGNSAQVVHHKKPFHLFPHLELDEENLVSMCNGCHLFVGHLGHFANYNPDIDEHIEILKATKAHVDSTWETIRLAKVKADAARTSKTQLAP